jgi:hypothetical protein
MTIADAFESASGCTMGEEFLSRFSIAINNDDTKPYLAAALALNPGNAPQKLMALSISNPDSGFLEWESFTCLVLDFSEPVDMGSVKNNLIIEPQASLVLKTSPGFSRTAIFGFAESPAWNKDFIISLDPGIRDEAGNESLDKMAFRIRTSGTLSKPPSLIGIRLPMAPGNMDNPEALIYSMSDIFSNLPIDTGVDRYPYATAVPAWIELYFDTALNTEIDLFSVMELFKIEATNNALSFSPRNIKSEDFTITKAVSGWENYCSIEIEGFMTNTVNSGVIGFYIRTGLEDKRGNKNSEAFRISLLK